jgi:hypothetical protein
MKKAVLFVLFLISVAAFSGSVNAQTLYFCESVDSEGYPIGESSVFNISSSGGYLNMLVRLPYTVDTREVHYDVYKVYGGSENYSTTITQEVERNWVWFWKQITFYDSGKYKIYVYDGNNNILTSGSIQINFR